jgi:hypothetical protein
MILAESDFTTSLKRLDSPEQAAFRVRFVQRDAFFFRDCAQILVKRLSYNVAPIELLLFRDSIKRGYFLPG